MIGDERINVNALGWFIEAVRRHIASFEPGTLIGSELNVARHLKELDGDQWEPWCVPGEVVFDDDDWHLDFDIGI